MDSVACPTKSFTEAGIWQELEAETNRRATSQWKQFEPLEGWVGTMRAALVRGGEDKIFYTSLASFVSGYDGYAAEIRCHQLSSLKGRIWVMPSPTFNLAYGSIEDWCDHPFFQLLLKGEQLLEGKTEGRRRAATVKHLVAIGGMQWKEGGAFPGGRWYQQHQNWKDIRELRPALTMTNVETWADFNVLDTRGYSAHVTHVANVLAGLKPTEALVCHCRAGLGRTGTLLLGALVKLWVDEQKGAKKVVSKEELAGTIHEMALEMRQARLGMVQTSSQYWQVHQFAWAYAGLATPRQNDGKSGLTLTSNDG